MTTTAISKNGVSIRLTDERWAHIIEEHAELTAWRQGVLETITHPDRVLAGSAGELLAIRAAVEDKWFVVVYRELETDGFVITAFLTSKTRSLDRRIQVWP